MPPSRSDHQLRGSKGVYADCVVRVTDRQQTDVSIVRPDPLAFLYTILLMCNASQSTVTVLARP